MLFKHLYASILAQICVFAIGVWGGLTLLLLGSICLAWKVGMQHQEVSIPALVICMLALHCKGAIPAQCACRGRCRHARHDSGLAASVLLQEEVPLGTPDVLVCPVGTEISRITHKGR